MEVNHRGNGKKYGKKHDIPAFIRAETDQQNRRDRRKAKLTLVDLEKANVEVIDDLVDELLENKTPKIWQFLY